MNQNLFDVNFKKLNLILYKNSVNSTIQSTEQLEFEKGFLKIMNNHLVVIRLKESTDEITYINEVFSFANIKAYKYTVYNKYTNTTHY
jgi:hypothetical protein